VNPCTMVEFPVSVAKTTRKPHYVPASEQERIQYFAPSYLRHMIVIIVEMGLRPYKELMPMQKSQVDLENRLVHIPDSKTPSGEGDMPMTDLAWQAFKEQMEETANSEYLFPSLKPRAKKKPHHQLKEVLGQNVAADRREAFLSVRVAAHVLPLGLVLGVSTIISFRKCCGKATREFSSGMVKPS